MQSDSSRFGRGVWWGVLATVVMSIPMLIATGTGVSPLPEPIPLALAKVLAGASAPLPVLAGIALVGHLGYGGLWGGVLAWSVRPVTLGWGLGLGAVLWLAMQVVVLPLLGWGLFGTSITPKFAVATLVLHLVYGATVGVGLDRTAAVEPA